MHAQEIHGDVMLRPFLGAPWCLGRHGAPRDEDWEFTGDIEMQNERQPVNGGYRLVRRAPVGRNADAFAKDITGSARSLVG